MIKQKIEKTHREKIKEFNNYLGSLTEHYDIPRVTVIFHTEFRVCVNVCVQLRPVVT